MLSVTRLGLACIEPITFDVGESPDRPRYENHRTWIEVKRDDDWFAKFLHEVARVLEMPLFPPTTGCDSCKREIDVRDLLANGGSEPAFEAPELQSAMRDVIRELMWERRRRRW